MWHSRSTIPVILIPLLCLLLSACEARREVVERQVVRPVKTLLLEEAAGMMRSFPASIEASKRVDLAFRVPGKLNSLPVQEGGVVVAGQLLASLDPTDFQLVLDDAEAEYDRASGDWERAKVLVVDGHLSRTDFDQLESVFKQALSAMFHNFTPHFVGFAGKYCQNDSLPLNLIILSSMVALVFGIKLYENFWSK